MSEDGKPSGKARDKVGAFAGISGRTLEKIAGLSMRGQGRPETVWNYLRPWTKAGASTASIVDPISATSRSDPRRTAALAEPWAVSRGRRALTMLG